MDRMQRKLFLALVCLVLLGIGYIIYSRSNAKASKEMKTGVKAMSDPEALLKELEK